MDRKSVFSHLLKQGLETTAHGQLPVSVTKNLLEHSLAHLFALSMATFIQQNWVVATDTICGLKPKIFTISP